MKNNRKLIVSLTSYPARLGTLDQVLATIYNQTRQADEIVLWLAREQFPELEQNVPETLMNLVAEKKLTIRWCDDLKPHKKYFYALQEYPEDLIVTIDDDLLYPEHMLENLYQCWLRHPKAVPAVRAHLMLLTEAGQIRPYSQWIKETDVCQDQPSMQLFATGGAGALYAPELFPKETFEKAAVLENCLWADDLWLKAMELIADVPVVVAQPFEDLRYVPGTQEEGLYHQNEDANRNDTQLAAISAWLDQKVEPGVLVQKLTQSEVGVRLLGTDVICEHFAAERAKQRQKIRTANSKLKQTYAEKSEINAKLKQTYEEKSEINAKLKKTYEEKSEINAKLKKTYEEKSEINAKLKQTYEEKSELMGKLKQVSAEKEAVRKELQGKLEKAWAEKSEINAKLQRTYAEKSEISAQLRNTSAEKTQVTREMMRYRQDMQGRLDQTMMEKKELNAKLQRTYAEKSEINAKLQKTYGEKAERGLRIKALEQELAAERFAHTFKGRVKRVMNFLKRIFRIN